VSEWFVALGSPLVAAERALVEQYLRGLGIVRTLPVEPVHDWVEARGVVTHTGWDPSWWDAEQAERLRLRSRAVLSRSEPSTLERLSSSLDADDDVMAAANRTAARFGCDDVGLVGSAAGAASEATYLAELARLANESPDHPFRVKDALFRRGRWPLGILDGRYWLF